MENKELIELMRTAIKEELQPINDRFEVLEIKQDILHRKLDSLEFNIKVTEREIKKDIRLLKDSQETLITVLEGHGILPKVEGQ